jgi:hypothetical protein
MTLPDLTPVVDFLAPVGAFFATVWASLAPVGAFLAPVTDAFTRAWEVAGAHSGGVPWWTVALVAALTLRALTVFGRGETGAVWRTLLALAAGGIVVTQLVLEGPDPAVLPLHGVAALVVVLVPWERPHPEAAQLRMGRRRRRNRSPWPRAALLLIATAAAAAAFFLL